MRRPYTPEELARIAINERSMSQFRAITKDPMLPNQGGHYNFSIEGRREGKDVILDFNLEALGLKLNRSYVFDNADRRSAYSELKNTCDTVSKYFLAVLLTQPIETEGV